MRGIIVRAMQIDTWFWIIALSAFVFAMYLAFLPEAEAFTLEEIEDLQEERTMLQEELAVLKTELEENQKAINKSATTREFMRNDIRLLKIAESPDEEIFARELILVQETKVLKDLKFDRISLLDEQSEKRQRMNSINDDIRYNVVELDEEEVELVSSEAINLQIDIEGMTEQIKLYDNIQEGVDDEIKANDEQIEEYTVLRDRYQRQYEDILSNSSTGWAAIASLEGAKTLADSFDNIIKALEEQKVYLEDQKETTLNERQTLITVIETSTNRLLEINEKTTHAKRLIGIQLSQQCITMIKNNFPTTCPTYYDLINIDQSNEYVSGYFVTDEKTGFLHRAEPAYKNSWRWYDDDNSTRIILDPPKGMAEKIPMITIENNFEVYFKPGDFTVDDDNLRKYNKHRSIERCKDALISSDVWQTMLTDTIEMLKTGCASTTIQTAFVDPLPKTEIDITTSPSWHYKNWMNASKDACKTICKQY